MRRLLESGIMRATLFSFIDELEVQELVTGHRAARPQVLMS